MLKTGLWLLLASLVLISVGWLSLASVVFEVIRVAAVVCLSLGLLLLFVDYVRTPDPADR